MAKRHVVHNEAFDEYFALMDAYEAEINKRNKPGLRYDGVRSAHQFALTYMQCRRLEEILHVLKASQ